MEPILLKKMVVHCTTVFVIGERCGSELTRIYRFL